MTVMGRGTQVVRERSAKPLSVSSILTRASKFLQLRLTRDPSLRSGFRLRAPASLTPANRLKFDSDPRLQFLQLRLTRDPSLCSGFRLRAPASLTPANRLKFDSDPRLQVLQLRLTGMSTR